LIYGSVCSGIEAATAAWHPLGWQPAFFSEIDKFPARVLAHHYPSVLNHGDMTKFKEWPDHAIDLLVGGTPCQSFSVAGLRQGLADPRGNLMLTFGAVAERYQPRWLVWENVPGVLSSDGGRDFGTFLGMLAELGYGFAYRVLDAQYVRVDGYPRAVPQRRRRVFVVGHLGDWRRAAAVLFEPESLRGDTPPSRKAGQDVAPTIAARTRGGGGLGTDFDCDGGLIPSVANPLTARMHKGINTTMDEGQTMVAHALRGEGFDASEDGTGRGTPIVPVAYDFFNITAPVNRQNRKPGDPCHTLARDNANHATIIYPETDRQWVVRRLTPTECERLQGFPDNYTDIGNGRGGPTPDGARYKALGNSMAVNVMRWIGLRINQDENGT
jgi:DNA (cytosine-5)-methyltransferase 1